jgi:Zinc-binding loop region of homing endonuclease
MASEDFFSEEDVTGDILASLANDGTVNLYTMDKTLVYDWQEIISGQDLPESSNELSDPSFDPSILSDIPWSERTLPLSEADFQLDEGDYDKVLVRKPPAQTVDEFRERLAAPTRRSTMTSRRALTNQDLAQKILDGLKTTTHEWCELSVLQPTKKAGYIQLSKAGFNKFACLQDVVLWAGGYQKLGGQDASHRCSKPACTVVGDVIPESKADNNQRKNCPEAIQCESSCVDCHGSRWILLCPHEPRCKFYVEGFTSEQDFLTNGLCKDRSSSVRKRANRRR